MSNRTLPTIRDRVKELRRVKAADLAPNPHNWRRHPEPQRRAMQEVLREIGYAGALLAREDDTGKLHLIDGHLRADITPEQDVPVLVLDVDEQEALKLLAVYDPLAAMAETNAAALAKLLGMAKLESEALKKLAGETAGEGGEKPIIEDEPPPVRPDAFTKPGDLWLLGSHRVLCGDSTKREDVDRVMAGEKAGLMNTDPPYGVAYANDDRPNPGVAKPRVANDCLVDEILQQFLESAFRPAKQIALAENAAWYLWHAHLTQGFFAAAAAAAAQVVLHRQIIWVKPVLLLGRGQYHWKHEPCFMGWVKGNQPPDYGLGNGERTQTTVWEIGSVTQAERKDFDHATPKPVGLFTIPMVKHLRVGEIAYDPFLGSGPQVIAAEQLGRRCFGLEIEPRYVDVICRRWAKLTGKTPVRDGDGVLFPLEK